MTRLLLLVLLVLGAWWLWTRLPKKAPPGSRPTIGGSPDNDATGMGPGL